MATRLISVANPMRTLKSQDYPQDEPGPGRSIGEKALAGSAWMIGASGASKVIGFGCQLAVAWFLTKREFGIYAIAVSFGVVMSIMRDGGLPMVLQQKGPGFDRFAGPAFWMMLAINSATGLLIAAAAVPAAGFYAIPELANVILLFAIIVPLTVLPSLLSLRLSLDLKFRQLGLLQVVSTLLRSGLLLFFAWAGYGALSFLLPLLITTVTDTIILWSLTRFSPWKMRPDFLLWPELFKSGRWIMLGTFAIAFEISGAYFLLGKILPSDVLGIYFFAYQMVVQLGMIIANNVYEVLFSSFVRIGKDLPRIRAAVPRALSVVVLVGAATSMSIAVVYTPLELLLWRGKWSEGASAVYVFALVWPAAAGISVMRAVQMATGRFHQWGIVALLGAMASVCGTVIGAYWGRSVLSAALGFAAGNAVGIALNARFALGGIALRAGDYAQSVLRPWLILAAGLFCARAIGSFTHSVIADLLVASASFAALGFLGLSIFANASLKLVLTSLATILAKLRIRRPYAGESV